MNWYKEYRAEWKEIIETVARELGRSYEADYKNVTQKLLYENVSYNYAVEQGIAIVAESKVFE